MNNFMSAKGGSAFGGKNWPIRVFFALALLTLMTPFWVFRDLLFPYVSSKAFFFRIVVELALPLYVYLVIFEKKLRPKLSNPLNIAVLVFLAVNIVSAILGVNPFRSLWGNFERMGGAYYLTHLVLLYFYVQVLGQAGGKYLKWFLQAFIASAVLVTLNGLSGWIGGPTIVFDPSLPVRVSSTFGNPIFFASFLILPMFLSAYFALQEENRTLKIFYWIGAFLQLLGVYSSGTRGAVVGLLAGLFIGAVVYVILAKNVRVRNYGLAVIGGFVIIVGGLFFYHNKLTPGSTLYRIANLRDSNTEARLIQWKIAWRGFKDKPFLGVGPENYYIISNTYYNPELYKYDASWFDKPHNFLLEVLVTTGIFGLALYLAIFLLSLYGLWKAYKAELLGLSEMCLLFAALAVYQIQNLFVFDTVSASVAFYAFAGFAMYMWTESQPAAQPEPAGAAGNTTWATAVFIAAICGILYVEYVSNILSVQAAKRVNYGYAYTSYDPQKAADYFGQALALPFNLDPQETANRYSDFINNLIGGDTSKISADFLAKQADKATANQRAVTEKIQNEPLLWMRLAIDEMNRAILRNQDVSVSKPAVDKAISLAPKRAELLQLRIQLDGYTKDWKDASLAAEQIVGLNPYNPELRWQLAMAYYLDGQIDKAVKEGDQAVAQGFHFTQLQQFAWYIQYYKKVGNNEKAAVLLEQAISFQPNEIGLYADLVQAYIALGNKERAMLILEMILKMDPSQKAALQPLFDQLKN